jgi:hypothetical protein
LNRNAEYTEAVQAIHLSADLMLRLVGDVLDISKLEAGKLELECHEFDLLQTLHSAASSVDKLVQRTHGTNVHFHTHLDPRVPRNVYGDSIRLLQVLYNLLSNANKFTDDGSIRLTVDVMEKVDVDTPRKTGKALENYTRSLDVESFGDVSESEAFYERSRGSVELIFQDSTMESKALLTDPEKAVVSECQEEVVVVIQVSDSGTGIPPEQLKSIFQPYTQSKVASYRKHGGTGLGLSVVSKLVEAMNGRISVKSKVGSGSTFTVQLPFRLASLSSTTFSQVSKIAPILEPKDILGPSRVVDSTMSQSVLHLPELPHGSSNSSSSISAIEKMSGERMFNFPQGKGVVLIVDDNDMNRKLLKRMLKGFGLQFMEACDGAQAVDVVMGSVNVGGFDKSDYELGLILMDLR